MVQQLQVPPSSPAGPLQPAVSSPTKANGKTQLHGRDAPAPAPEGLRPTADWRHISVIGFMSSTAGGIMYWQAAMLAGFGAGFAAIITGGIAFILILVCMAELTSTIPLSGGTFGFVRVSMGPQPASIAGIMETLAYVFSAECFLIGMLNALTLLNDLSAGANVCICLAFLLLAVGFLCFYSHWLWRVTLPVAVVFQCVQVCIWLICLTTARWSNTKVAHVELRGADAYFSMAVPGLFMWVGVESMTLSADPRKNMPKGMILGILLTVACSLITAIIVSAAAPGLQYELDLLDAMQPPLEHALPGGAGTIVAGVFGFFESWVSLFYTIHAIGRILYALSRGGIFPRAFSDVRSGAPVYAIISGATATFAIFAVLSLAGDVVSEVVPVVNMMCTFSGLLNYIFVFTSFSESPAPVLIAAATWPSFVIVMLLSGLALSYWIFYAQFHVGLTPEEVLTIGAKVTAAKLVQSGLGYTYLKQHCERELNTENLDCVKMIQELREAPAVAGFEALYLKHLSRDSVEPANITSSMFARAASCYQTLKAAREAAEAALAQQQQQVQRPGRREESSGTQRLVGTQESSASTDRREESGAATPGDTSNRGSTMSSTLPSSRAGATGPLHMTRHVVDPTATDPEVRRILSEDVGPLLVVVEAELTSLIEKDILPRFKTSKYFVEYLEKEPVLFKETQKHQQHNPRWGLADVIKISAPSKVAPA